MVDTEPLRDLISSSREWLLIRDSGPTFPIYGHEIEISDDGGKAHFGFLDDKGFHNWRLNSFTLSTDEATLDVAGAFAKKRETLRLVARTLASELAAEIEAARLERANEIGRLISENFPTSKLGRVSLNEENGRFALIHFDTAEQTPMAAIADVTGSLSVEAIFTTALLWAEKLSIRKKNPVSDIWIICEKRQAKNAQKLLALLTDRWHTKISVVEIERKSDPPRLIPLQTRKISELWREKAPKLILPQKQEPGVTSQHLIDLYPNEIDIVFSRQGETLRFRGLPFARVRSMMGQEKAWFGVGRERQILTQDNWDDCAALIEALSAYRSPETANKRHEYYRSAPEAWLESILRRNIKLLDTNLILSPIYNQFRFFRDKIDLLAMRRDGRLVIIELKTQPDRVGVFQSVDYWRKIELQRRRGILAAADLFEGREIADKPAIIYFAAPAWSFHRDFEYFARCVSPEIELWRFDLHENWRQEIKVVSRQDYAGFSSGFMNR